MVYNNAVRGQKQRVGGSRCRSIIIVVSSRRLDLVGSIDPIAIHVHRSRQVVDVRLICYAADFAAQMPDVVFVVELATDGLGVVAEQTVEHSV